MNDTVLKKGHRGGDVRRLQLYLCRIGASFACVPKIGKLDGVFGEKTENGVRAFQELYRLSVDGIVCDDTLKKIREVFSFFSRIEDLQDLCHGVPKQYKRVLSPGCRGADVVAVQYFLALISEFSNLPYTKTDGIYGEKTATAVGLFQKDKGLPITANVDLNTWERLSDGAQAVLHYISLQGAIPESNSPGLPDITLAHGNVGPPVRKFKLCLKLVCDVLSVQFSSEINNIFDMKTLIALREFQKIFDLPQSGQTDVKTRALLRRVCRIAYLSTRRLPFQYPGYPVKAGCKEREVVCNLQRALRKLSVGYGFPSVFPDGIFGEETLVAVETFGCDEVDFLLWKRIMAESGYLC